VAALATAAAPVCGMPLDQPVQATFHQLPLRSLLSRLQSVTGVPLVLDRRIDPTQRISLEGRGESLAALLGRLAADTGSELAPLEASVWLVPPGEAGRLIAADAARRVAVSRLPPPSRRRLAEAEAWSWPAGATPIELLAELAAATGGPRPTVAGIADKLPHDHLAAGSLPPLSLAERCDLIAMQYGLRVGWRAAGSRRLVGELLPLPDGGVVGDRTPNRPRRPMAPRRAVARGRQRYTLRVAAPLDELLTAVAGQLGLEAAIDADQLRRRAIDPREIIRLEVSDVDRDGLLDAIITPLGLTWSIDGGRLRVPGEERVRP